MNSGGGLRSLSTVQFWYLAVLWRLVLTWFALAECVGGTIGIRKCRFTCMTLEMVKIIPLCLCLWEKWGEDFKLLLTVMGWWVSGFASKCAHASVLVGGGILL